MKTHKRSTRDTHEIVQNEHDEDMNARRMVLVGGGNVQIDVDTSNITESITEALKGLKLDIPKPLSAASSKTERPKHPFRAGSYAANQEIGAVVSLEEVCR